MRSVIAGIKVAAFIGYSTTGSLLYLAGLGVLRLFLLPGAVRWKNLFMWSWAVGMTVIFRMKVQKRGTPPDAPFFLVCNHLSYLDIVPMYLFLNCTFVAKKEVRSWPLLGFIVDKVRVIFVDRTRRKDVVRVNREFDHACRNDQGIVMFPEGTSSGGRQVLKFRPSLLEFPAARRMPVHYASIHYQTSGKDEPAVDSVCFFGARDPFFSHVFKMAKNRRIDCTIHFGEDTIQSDDRKELAAKLHEKVKTIFIPTDSPE